MALTSALLLAVGAGLWPRGEAWAQGGGVGAAADDSEEVNRARRALSDIPGMDFSSLSPTVQKELASALTDEFCYCGCPHTVLQCLKSHTSCKHAKKFAVQAASLARAGKAGQEIIVDLSRHYQSFREPRQAVKVDPRMCKGPKDAKVTLVTYSDFECPYCGAARPIFDKFVQGRNDVRLCYAPFPLSAHPNAIPAGQAALFARDQGKFWAMHDLLFENQSHLSVGVIKQLGAKAGLKAADLSKALEQNRYLDELNSWKESGQKAGVESTPTVFINGRKLIQPLSADALNQAVSDELEWVANKNAWAAD